MASTCADESACSFCLCRYAMKATKPNVTANKRATISTSRTTSSPWLDFDKLLQAPPPTRTPTISSPMISLFLLRLPMYQKRVLVLGRGLYLFFARGMPLLLFGFGGRRLF